MKAVPAETPMDPDDNRRRERRNRTYKSGRIIFNGGYSVVNCTVRNVSEGGALLELPTVAGIPHSFDLEIAPHPKRRCNVMWTTDTRIGVAFTEPAKS